MLSYRIVNRYHSCYGSAGQPLHPQRRRPHQHSSVATGRSRTSTCDRQTQPRAPRPARCRQDGAARAAPWDRGGPWSSGRSRHKRHRLPAHPGDPVPRTALLTLSPRNRWQARANRRQRAWLVGCSVDPEGNLTADPIANCSATSPTWSSPWERPREADRGVVMLLDEVQFLSAAQGRRSADQRPAQVRPTGPAGDPCRGRTAPRSPNWQGRPVLRRTNCHLPRHRQPHRRAGPQRPAATSKPKAPSGTPDSGALALAANLLTGNYPFFLQELGYAVWPAATGPQIHRSRCPRHHRALPRTPGRQLLRVLDRTTDLEKAYLPGHGRTRPRPGQRAGHSPDSLGRSSRRTTRATPDRQRPALLPGHGLAAFHRPPLRPIHAPRRTPPGPPTGSDHASDTSVPRSPGCGPP